MDWRPLDISPATGSQGTALPGLSWPAPKENSPLGLLNPRGQHTVSAPVIAGLRPGFASSPPDLIPAPPIVTGYRRRGPTLFKGWRCGTGNVDCLRPTLLVAYPGVRPTVMPPTCPGYHAEGGCSPGSSDNLSQGAQGPGRDPAAKEADRQHPLAGGGSANGRRRSRSGPRSGAHTVCSAT